MPVTINGDGAITGLVITTADLASNSVTTAKIADVNVTTAKIADSAITTGKIADVNVTTAKIADVNVTTAKIAANAVTVAKMAREGSSGQVLTSNGAGSDPSYQTISTTPTTAQVLTATAGASVGAVGTYAYLGRTIATASAGTTYAGSDLRYSGIYQQPCNYAIVSISGSYLSGTWRAMGSIVAGTGQGGNTLFLRIS